MLKLLLRRCTLQVLTMDPSRKINPLVSKLCHNDVQRWNLSSLMHHEDTDLSRLLVSHNALFIYLARYQEHTVATMLPQTAP